MLTSAILSLFLFSAITLLGLLLLQPAFTYYVHNYQVRVRPRRQTDEVAAQRPADSRLLDVCRSIGEVVLNLVPGLADKRTVHLLTMANYRTPQHLAIHTGLRTIVTGSVLLIGLMAAGSNPINLVLAVPASLLGWLLVNFFLAARVKRRQKQILTELPTIIDLLIVCAQAGLGLLMAVNKVSQEIEDSCPVLAGELSQLINDVKIFAKSVPHALTEMGERCGVDELVNMASALVAAESKGSDISYPLRQQAEALRDRLKRRKEEEAAKVPVKMVPVIMTFIMPLILAPMLGPAVVTIIEALYPIVRGGK